MKMFSMIKDRIPGLKRGGFWIFEIGTPFIKGAFCRHEDRAFRIQKIIIEPLDNPVKENLKAYFNKIVDPQERNAPIWAFISRNVTTVRNLELPSTDRQELAAMVDLQLTKQSPYSREEIVTDWHLEGQTPAGFSRAILAIAHRLLLTEYFEALKDSGFQVEKVGLVSSGLYHFVPKTVDGAILILEIGAVHTVLEIVSQKPGQAPCLLFSRSIPVGEIKLAENESEGLEKLHAEIKRSIEIGQSEQALKNPPKNMLLFGASKHLTSLQDRISRELGIPCELGPALEKKFLFSKTALEDLVRIEGTHSMHSLLGCVSLPRALHFDLMPSELKLTKSLKDRSQEIVRLGIILVVFITSLSGLFFEKIYKETQLLQMLDKRYEKTAQKAENIEQMRGVLALVRRRMGADGSALQFLEILHQVTPEDIYYMNIVFDEGDQMSIKGYSKAMASIFDFVTKFDKLGWFKNVETKYATKKTIREQELVEFEIIGKFKEKTVKSKQPEQASKEKDAKEKPAAKQSSQTAAKVKS